MIAFGRVSEETKGIFQREVEEEEETLLPLD